MKDAAVKFIIISTKRFTTIIKFKFEFIVLLINAYIIISAADLFINYFINFVNFTLIILRKC